MNARRWISEALHPRRTEMQARIEHYVDKAEHAEATASAALSVQRRMAAELHRRDQTISVLTEQLELLQKANEHYYRQQQDTGKEVPQ